MSTKPPGQKRVLLWCIPRSCSTAFARCILNIKEQKVNVIFERFFKPFYFGIERQSDRYTKTAGRFKKGLTYLDAKAIYEQEYPDYDCVFVKEMAVYLQGKLSNWDYIPANYQHTFLIRHPDQTIPNLYTCLTDKERNGTDYFDGLEANYEPIVQLYNLVANKSSTPPVVIDAEDLLAQPEAVLKAYCDKTGLPFDPSMLHWGSGDSSGRGWDRWPGWYEELHNSTGFMTAESLVKYNPRDFPKEVQDCIQKNLPYYKEIYKHRIQV